MHLNKELTPANSSNKFALQSFCYSALQHQGTAMRSMALAVLDCLIEIAPAQFNKQSLCSAMAAAHAAAFSLSLEFANNGYTYLERSFILASHMHTPSL